MKGRTMSNLMRIIFNVVFFLLCSFSITAADLSLGNDQRPGSRSIYVAERNGYFLKLMLRKCNCEQSRINPEKAALFCPCFGDCRPEDQPFIQGNPYSAIAHFQKFGVCFFGFGGGRDQATNQFFVKVPDPEQLLKILQLLNLDHIELVSGAAPLNTDQYFQFLRSKKIPVAKIPDPNEVNDISMLYHAYFHDVFNHLFLWIALPDSLREIIAKRAEVFINKFAAMRQDFLDNNDQEGAFFIDLLKFIAAAKFDTAMGSSNNSLLEPGFPFSLVGIHNDEAIKIENSFLYFINFGISFESYTHRIFKPEAFFEKWLRFYARESAEEFVKLSKSGSDADFDSFNAIQKDSVALRAFNHIKGLPVEEIMSISRRVTGKYVDIFGKLEDTPFEESTLPTIDELYQQIIARYQQVFDEQKK
jgi:hypothetical protein